MRTHSNKNKIRHRNIELVLREGEVAEDNFGHILGQNGVDYTGRTGSVCGQRTDTMTCFSMDHVLRSLIQ